jgi:plasmid stabilization system protein ParE
VISYTRRAAALISGLLDHYETKERPEAMQGLLRALHDAWAEIENNPAAGLPAPRPYPALARPGQFWVKAGRYWVGFRRQPALIITAVYYDAADIPGRLD